MKVIEGMSLGLMIYFYISTTLIMIEQAKTISSPIFFLAYVNMMNTHEHRHLFLSNKYLFYSNYTYKIYVYIYIYIYIYSKLYVQNIFILFPNYTYKIYIFIPNNTYKINIFFPNYTYEYMFQIIRTKYIYICFWHESTKTGKHGSTFLTQIDVFDTDECKTKVVQFSLPILKM
jgi:hypothetical protein